MTQDMDRQPLHSLHNNNHSRNSSINKEINTKASVDAVERVAAVVDMEVTVDIRMRP